MTLRIRACLVSVICLTGLGAGMSTHQVGAADGQSYLVQANDTLSAIAVREHTSQAELMRLNGITDPNHILIGQTLILSQNGTAAQGGSAGYASTTADQTESNDRQVSAGAYGTDTGVYSGSVRSTTRAYPTPIAGYTGSGRTATRTYPIQSAAYTSAATGMTYVVQPGDSLGALSNRFGVSITTLADLNGLARPELLLAGQRLEIPAGAVTANSALGTSATYATTLPSPTAVGGVFSRTAEQTGGSNLPLATATPATFVAAAGGTTSGSGTNASQTSVGSVLAAEAAAYGVDPALVKAVAWQESGWRMVTAADGGIGVMQLMPATAAWVGPALLGRVIDPNNVQDNIQAGVALLASYLHTYGGNVQEALAAYNAGPGNLANGIPSYAQQYINDVLSLRAGYAQ